MYSPKALARRQCTATRKDGDPCGAFACWDDRLGRCAAHAGRLPTGPRKKKKRIRWTREMFFARPVWPHARYVPCTCRAYSHPHRPGGGACRWPDAPLTVTTPEDDELEVGALRELREMLRRRAEGRTHGA